MTDGSSSEIPPWTDAMRRIAGIRDPEVAFEITDPHRGDLGLREAAPDRPGAEPVDPRDLDDAAPVLPQREDLAALVERQRRMRATAVLDIVSMTEIAERAGTTTGTVSMWRYRHKDFPEPLARLAIGPIWQWADVAAWLAKPRRPGRPRKG